MLRSLFAVGLIWSLGCSQSPPPIVIAPSIESTAPEWKVPPKPKESDAAAKKLFAEMISAHTGGKPEKLGKLTSVSAEREGTARGSDGAQAPVSWKVKFAGKTKCHAIVTYLIPQGSSLISVYNDGKGYFGQVGRPTMSLNASGLRDVALQMGEESCLYLFGFDDPALVAQTATLPKIGDREMLGLHIWTPTIEHVLLSLDAKTKRIERLRYMGAEAGTPTIKEVTIASHREIDGYQLPEKYTVTANGLLLFDWNKLTFDIGGKFDPKLFDIP